MLESAAAWGAGCALSWGVSDIVARFAGRSVGVLVATCTMMTIGAVLIAAAMAATGEPFDWRLDGIHWLIGIGAGTVLGSILFYHAVTHGPVSLASPVVACYPAIAVPISVALGARPEPVHWVAMVATMAGVWLVARATPSGEGAAPEYAPAVVRRTILYSLIAAATYAASLTAADRAIEIYGPWQTVLIVRLIGFVALGAILLVRRERVRFPVRAWPVLAAFGLLDTLGHLLLYIGLDLPHGEYAIVASVGYTVVTVVAGAHFPARAGLAAAMGRRRHGGEWRRHPRRVRVAGSVRPERVAEERAEWLVDRRRRFGERHVPETRQNCETGAGDEPGHGPRHGGRVAGVVLAGHDQGRARDPFQTLRNLGVALGKHAVNLPIDGRVVARDPPADKRDRFRRLGAERRREPAFERGLQVRRRPLRLRLTDALADRVALGGAAVVRRVQDRERRKPVRMIQREAARDHAAEREPRDCRAGDTAAVHEPEQLRGEHGEIGRAGGPRALSVPQQIVSEHAEMRRESGELPLPHRAVEPEAVNLNDRGPASVQLPGRFARATGAHTRLPFIADSAGIVTRMPALPPR